MNAKSVSMGARASTLERVIGALSDGLTAIGVVLALFALAQQPVPGSDIEQAPAALAVELPAESRVEPAIGSGDPRYRALAAHLSQRYKIAPDAAERVVSGAHIASLRFGIDPLLVLAVIAVESSFNPVAESLAGAKGLMQVVPRYHEDKLEPHGGSATVLDPMTNILVGSRILDQYIRHSGSLEAGLQRYNGARSDPSTRYAQKVLAERARLQRVVDRVDRTRVVL
jgi:soluble lytic murein transglycosylase-like protein